jgi:hypothetical protein
MKVLRIDGRLPSQTRLSVALPRPGECRNWFPFGKFDSPAIKFAVQQPKLQFIGVELEDSSPVIGGEDGSKPCSTRGSSSNDERLVLVKVKLVHRQRGHSIIWFSSSH